jgi:ADP-ribosylglycohydrolase
MQAHAQSMVLASFAADSLALGTHWIYDTTIIEQQFGRITSLLAPHKGTYHPTKTLGDFTHYGDQSFHLLEYLTTCKGHFDIAAYYLDWQRFFSHYQGYLDQATKETLKNIAAGKGPDTCGSHSADLGGPVRIAPLIYCYRHNLDEMLVAVKTHTSLTHCGPGVLDGALFLARSCYMILHGATPREAIEHTLAQPMDSAELQFRLRKCLDPPHTNTRQQVKEFGQMCSINAALPGAIYAVLKNEDSLENALIETVMAGGDSSARGMAVAMLLGAYHGSDKIPRHWLENLNKYRQILADLDQLP